MERKPFSHIEDYMIERIHMTGEPPVGCTTYDILPMIGQNSKADTFLQLASNGEDQWYICLLLTECGAKRVMIPTVYTSVQLVNDTSTFTVDIKETRNDMWDISCVLKIPKECVFKNFNFTIED